MARTKQTARKSRGPAPSSDKTIKPNKPNKPKKTKRKKSQFWSPCLVPRKWYQNVKLEELEHFTTGDHVTVIRRVSDDMYGHIVHFDKLHKGIYYGFIGAGKDKQYVHFHVDCVQSLTRVLQSS